MSRKSDDFFRNLLRCVEDNFNRFDLYTLIGVLLVLLSIFRRPDLTIPNYG